MPTELVEVEGHIIDSLILAKVLDVIVATGADYRVVDVEIGKTNVDTSRARLEVMADDDAVLEGLRITAPERPRGSSPFEFMASEVSSEKPKALLVADVARRVHRAKTAGGKVLAVAGPAVVHTGAASHLAELVRAGWIDLLF